MEGLGFFLFFFLLGPLNFFFSTSYFFFHFVCLSFCLSVTQTFLPPYLKKLLTDFDAIWHDGVEWKASIYWIFFSQQASSEDEKQTILTHNMRRQ